MKATIEVKNRKEALKDIRAGRAPRQKIQTVVVKERAAMIEFIPLAVRPDTPIYGGIAGEFSFVITLVKEGYFSSKFHASVKPLGGTKFDGTRIDLGYFSRFDAAAKACDVYYRKHTH